MHEKTASSTKSRPFRVLGIQHVAVGGPTLDALRHLWVDLLGLESQSVHEVPHENVREERVAFVNADCDVKIDLMQPLDAQAKPRVDKPALHHIALHVDNLQAAFDWLSAQGVRFTPGGIRRGAEGHPVCFIHPFANESHRLSGEGVLIELVEAA